MAATPKPLLRPGLFYHLCNRGNNRRLIFKDDRDYLRFLSVLPKYLDPVMQLYAYALLPDHFHLLVRVHAADRLSEHFHSRPTAIGNTIGHLQNSHAKYFLARHHRREVSGLFERSFERKPVASSGHLRNTVHYINFNAENHGYCHDARDYHYTSLQELLYPPVKPLVDTQAVYSVFGGEDNFRMATKEEVKRRLG